MAFYHKRLEIIESWGFEGFLPVSKLKLAKYLNTVPRRPGVILVLNPTLKKPNWLSKSVGGHYEDKDPTVTSECLDKNWVDRATILYVGQTGQTRGEDRTLHKRISELIQFGSGKPIGHRGGRLIWQLDNHNELVICWLVDRNPAEVKKEIISEFKFNHDSLPFANLRDPT